MLKFVKIISISLFTVLFILFSTLSFSAKTGQNELYNLSLVKANGGYSLNKTIPYAYGHRECLIATNKRDYHFSKWKILGEYELIEGTLKDSNIIIELHTDCTATPCFTAIQGSEGALTTTANNQSNNLPVNDKESFKRSPVYRTIVVSVSAIVLLLLLWEVRKFFVKRKIIKISKIR